MTIILPSHAGHATMVGRLLTSIRKHVLDRADVRIKLIISQDDVHAFAPLIANFWDLKIDVTVFSALLARHGMPDADEGQLLRRVGKFNFQATKKLLGAYEAESEWSLIVDSEHVFVRDCRMADLIADYAESKYVYYSPFHPNAMTRDVTKNCLDMIGQPFRDLYMFEVQSWFIEKRIIHDLVESLGGAARFTGTMLRPSVKFEMVLYYWFIYHNNRYGYDFRDSMQVWRDELPPRRFDEFEAGIQKVGWNVMEYVAAGMTENTLGPIIAYFERERIAFYRPMHARHTDTAFKRENAKLQKQFLERCKAIKVLACCPFAQKYERACQ